jgi:glyoxylase-like metal-dependent hydrolase (beta-lactamase superfamily II)
MSDDLNFTVQRPPAYGELTDLLPGMFWVRLPMPTAPNHVNCWLLDNGPGWTMVDCGLNTDDSFEMWDKLWRGLLRSRPLQNLTLTHAHADHSGLAATFVKETRCSVRMALAEWLTGWKTWHERDESSDEHFVAFLKRNGASSDDASKIAEAQQRSIFLGGRPPREFIRIRDGDVIAMGKRDWRVITASGHSAEHALFFCESEKILIAGDQILSHMVPSVITPAGQPEANPMKDYLESLSRLEALPPDTLVLPSHGLPFRGLHARIAQKREHHQARLDDVASVINDKTNAFLVAQEIFPRVLYANPRQAFGEALAHLNMLASMGKLTRDVDGDGNIAFAAA